MEALDPVTEVSAWCRECESGSGEGSVDDVAAVLDLAEAVSQSADEVVGVGEGSVGLAGSAVPIRCFLPG
jgi:hypothetical protein